MPREPENQKDVATDAERLERADDGTQRQVEQAKEKKRVTGAW